MCSSIAPACASRSFLLRGRLRSMLRTYRKASALILSRSSIVSGFSLSNLLPSFGFAEVSAWTATSEVADVSGIAETISDMVFSSEKCTVGCPTCGGLINEAFGCHQAAWLRSLRRLDNLRYIARQVFILFLASPAAT